MSGELGAVVDRVRDRVTPAPDERAALQRVAEAVIADAEAAVADLPVDATVTQVGSTARGTWTAGDRDIDVFVCFPPDIDRQSLEEYGLQVGHAVLPAGVEAYAEHPYVVGEREGYEVDLVPCYAVEAATDIRSAVDRTPFHTRYLESRLDDDTAGAVRVTKQFLKGIGVYGSDLRTRGFSGFLTELLVLEYGGFEAFVTAVADWHPPVELDPEGHGAASFDDPLVVDPTDPNRNVAAVCDEANVARVQHYARALLANPDDSYFERGDTRELAPAEVATAFADRDTTAVALRFDAPAIVDDQLWPQLRKSLAGLTDALERRGFEVFRSAAFASGDPTSRVPEPDAVAVLLLELTVAELPAIERHEGPPVHVRDHADGFYETYAEDPAVTGPFIEGDRYVVERPREWTDGVAFLESDAVMDVRLGPHVETALDAGYEVLVGAELTALADAFGGDLARYVDPKP